MGCGLPQCGAGHRFLWPAEFEHGAQTTNNDRLHCYMLKSLRAATILVGRASTPAAGLQTAASIFSPRFVCGLPHCATPGNLWPVANLRKVAYALITGPLIKATDKRRRCFPRRSRERNPPFPTCSCSKITGRPGLPWRTCRRFPTTSRHSSTGCAERLPAFPPADPRDPKALGPGRPFAPRRSRHRLRRPRTRHHRNVAIAFTSAFGG